MSSLKRSLFLSVFGAAMSGVVAFAADLPSPPIIEYEPEPGVEIGSNWYLRGDLGLAVYQGADASWKDPSGHNQIIYSNQNLKHGWVAGIGAGYYFNEYFRADITLDYRHKIRHDANADCRHITSSGCTTPPPTSREVIDFSAWTLFANGYYDFGTYHMITPYVGGGVGVAWLKAHDHKTNGLSGGDTFKNNTQTNFAWNLTAGAAFDVADNLKLDANYRFVSLGKARTGARKNGTSGTEPIKFEDLYAHDFRIGLRYDLN